MTAANRPAPGPAEHTPADPQPVDPADPQPVEHKPAELANARRLLFEDRLGEAMGAIEHMLLGALSPRDRVAALTLRLIALINMGRSGEFPAALDAAVDASKAAPDPGQYGELQALAAVVAMRSGSLDRSVRHLVWGARALSAVDLTDTTIAWAWHNLAIAYSHAGFHGHAMAAMERAREVAAVVGVNNGGTDFAAPVIALRLAVDLDQRGDNEGCQRVLHDLVHQLDGKDPDRDLRRLRPVSRAAYGFAMLRLAALGARQPVSAIDPWPLLESAGDSVRSRDLRTLAVVCRAIAERRPIEAVARLETAVVADESLGAAEVPRLRALAHLAAGDHASAYEADRHAFRVATRHGERLRDLFVDGVAAGLDHEDLHRSVDHFRGEAQTDPLTGLPNRRYLEQYVADLVAAGRQAVLGVCDLDGFTMVNTVHGHVSGDLVLQRIAGVLNRVMRREDLVARYGGDEFVMILPTTSPAETPEIARRVATAVAAEDWHELVPGTPVAVSIGWTGLSAEGLAKSVADAVEAADHALARSRARPRTS